MSRQSRARSLSSALGAAFVASALAAPLAQAAAPSMMADNPFAARDLAGGYQQLAHGCGGDKSDGDKSDEGKCGEGKCGEGKCGEGRCGA